MRRLFYILALSLLCVSLYAEGVSGTLVKAASDALQLTVSKNVGKKEADTINRAIAEYLENPEGTAKSAKYAALTAAINNFIKDEGARNDLFQAVNNAQQGKKVDNDKVGNALMRSGVLAAIDSSHLSAQEKNLARAAVDELSGKEGSLQNASIEAFKEVMVKNGIAKDKAEAIGNNVSAYVSDTKNTTALKSAASIALQDAVSKNVGRKEAAVINAAISEYLDNPDGTAKSAAYQALQVALDKYISDPDAKAALEKELANARSGSKVDGNKVGNALMRSGVLAAIDSSHLSAQEKNLARAAVDELSGKEGSLQNASIEAFKEVMVKNGIAKDKAEAIGNNVSAYVSDTKNTTALKSAASIALQDAVSKNVGRKEAAVINAAISEYLDNPDGTAKSAAYQALQEAIGKYISDPDAKAALNEELSKARAGQTVDGKKVGNALVKGGLNTIIDNSNLTEGEKALAKAAVNEIFGNGGDFTEANAKLLKEKLIKNGFPEDKAAIVADNAAKYIANPKDTNALKLAAGTALQEIVNQHVDEKGAAVINKAIEEYLNNPDGTASSAAYKALEEAINQYVKDEASKAALLEALGQVKAGEKVDVCKVGAVLCKAGLDSLIDNSNLSEEEKRLAKALVAQLAGQEGALAEATAESLKKLLMKNGFSEEKAESIARKMQDYLADTGNTAALRAAASEALQDVVSRYVGKDGAEIINAAIANYFADGGTLSSAEEAALFAAIDKYITDEKSKQELKDAISKMKKGEEVDLSQLGSSLFKGSMYGLIDGSHLSERDKKLLKGLVDEMSGEDGALTNAGLEALEGLMVKAGISQEDASNFIASVKEYINGTTEGYDGIIASAKTIFTHELAEAIDKQLAKLGEKYPILKKLFDKWGINGDKIANFIMNITMEDIKNFFEKICNMTWEDWKELGLKLMNKLLDMAFQKAIDAIAKFAVKELTEFLNKFYSKVMARLAKIKALDDYMAIIQVAGAVMTEAISTEVKGVIEEGKTQLNNLWNSRDKSNGNSTVPVPQK